MKRMQIPFSFDPVTVAKIKKSALLATTGFVVAALGILMADPATLAFLQQHPVVGAAIAAYVPLIVNAVNEWRKGQEPQA